MYAMTAMKNSQLVWDYSNRKTDKFIKEAALHIIVLAASFMSIDN